MVQKSRQSWPRRLQSIHNQKHGLLQRETPNSILNKSVQFCVQTWLRQIDNASIVVDSLAVMVLYSVQVRATSFSESNLAKILEFFPKQGGTTRRGSYLSA